jgi:hypothetical protein
MKNLWIVVGILAVGCQDTEKSNIKSEAVATEIPTDYECAESKDGKVLESNKMTIEHINEDAAVIVTKVNTRLAKGHEATYSLLSESFAEKTYQYVADQDELLLDLVKTQFCNRAGCVLEVKAKLNSQGRETTFVCQSDTVD